MLIITIDDSEWSQGKTADQNRNQAPPNARETSRTVKGRVAGART